MPNLNLQFQILEKVQDKRYKPARWYVATPLWMFDRGETTLAGATEKVAELNEYYGRVGREFKLQTRQIGEWEDA